MDDKTYWSSIAEAKTVLEFTRRGYDVFTSCSGKSGCDMVVIKDQEISRVQVKCSNQRSRSGNWQVELKSVRSNKTKNNIINFDSTKCDILAIYLPQEDRLEILVSIDYHGMSAITIKTGMGA